MNLLRTLETAFGVSEYRITHPIHRAPRTCMDNANPEFVPLSLVLDNDTLDQQQYYLAARSGCLVVVGPYGVDVLFKAHAPRLG